ncbi:hypothetical protein FQA39_LY14819 [Lamprigera yunnana]|nr:hypothetical protein FQA39_LY14819 [Lamprigera yunnana]
MAKTNKNTKSYKCRLNRFMNSSITLRDSFKLSLLGFNNQNAVLSTVKSENSVNDSSDNDIIEIDTADDTSAYKNRNTPFFHDHSYACFFTPAPMLYEPIVAMDLVSSDEESTNLTTHVQLDNISISECSTILIEDDVKIEDIVKPIEHFDLRITEEGVYKEECQPFLQNDETTNRKDLEMWKVNFFYYLQGCFKCNSKGDLPIHEAVLENNISEVIKQCLVLRWRQYTINVFNQKLMTPLQLAIVYSANNEIIKTLLEFQADPLTVDCNGNTVLHLAILYSKIKTFISFLLMARFDLNVVNRDGNTPLMFCVIHHKHIQASAILCMGADPNLRHAGTGSTALFQAIENNDWKMVNVLLKHKAHTNIPNYLGYSPFDVIHEIDGISNSIKKKVTEMNLKELSNNLFVRNLQTAI